MKTRAISVFQTVCHFLFFLSLSFVRGGKGGRVGVGVDRSEAWFLSNVFNRLKLCLFFFQKLLVLCACWRVLFGLKNCRKKLSDYKVVES